MSEGAVSILEEFQEKFRVHSLLVREFEHWYWSVRPVQCTLGASILSLKRAAEKFSALNPEESAELAAASSVMEQILGEAFHYDKINYLMLMMVDPQVHFHVVPRYASKRSFAGREWSDAGWPKLPALTGEPENEETLSAVAERLRSRLRESRL